MAFVNILLLYLLFDSILLSSAQLNNQHFLEEYPYLAFIVIHRTDEADNEFIIDTCEGIVITLNIVLTAGRCFHAGEEATAIIGSFDKRVIIDIDRWLIHELYRVHPRITVKDMVAAILKTPVPVEEGAIKLFAFPNELPPMSVRGIVPCKVIGWKRMSKSEVTLKKSNEKKFRAFQEKLDIIYSFPVHILSYVQCKTRVWFQLKEEVALQDSMLCADELVVGSHKWLMPGGPLLCRYKQANKYVVVGLKSRVDTVNFSLPMFFVRIEHLAGFFQKNLAEKKIRVYMCSVSVCGRKHKVTVENCAGGFPDECFAKHKRRMFFPVDEKLIHIVSSVDYRIVNFYLLLLCTLSVIIYLIF